MIVLKNRLNFVSLLRNKKVGLCFLFISILSYLIIYVLTFSGFGGDYLQNIALLLLFVGLLTNLLCFVFSKGVVKKVSGVILLLIVFIVFLFIFVVRLHRVTGNSMNPNMANDEFILSSKLFNYTLQRGDIVLYEIGLFPGRDYISRIVGFPGEHVSIRQNKIYINGSELSEPYLPVGTRTTSGSYVSDKDTRIPYGEFMVLGDNRSHSFDSRYFGFVDAKLIKEKAILMYWPVLDIRMLSSDRVVFSDTASLVPSATPFYSCRTLGGLMVNGVDGKGEIGCDIEVDGEFDLYNSYCEGQTTHLRNYLVPDAYGRINRYYATLTGLDPKEEVKVFVYTTQKEKVECLPSLNK